MLRGVKIGCVFKFMVEFISCEYYIFVVVIVRLVMDFLIEFFDEFLYEFLM